METRGAFAHKEFAEHLLGSGDRMKHMGTLEVRAVWTAPVHSGKGGTER